MLLLVFLLILGISHAQDPQGEVICDLINSITNSTQKSISSVLPSYEWNVTKCTSNDDPYFYCKDWTGITCNSDNSITSLNVTSFVSTENIDTAVLPDSIADLSNLTILVLSKVNFIGTIPPWIGNFQKLVYLDLTFNKFTPVLPTEVGSLSDTLEHLDLSYNLFTGTIPNSYFTLTKLTYFGIGINGLNGTLPTLMFNIPNLKTLFLKNNQFTGSIPTHYATLKKLTYLDLSVNNLKGSFPYLSGLPQLKSLVLSQNKLILGDDVGRLSNLANLEFSSNLQNGTIMRSLGQLALLTNLVLDRNNFVGTIPTEIGKLENLNYFTIYKNQISGKIPTELGLLPLTRLTLANNLLSGTIPIELTRIKSLVQLELHNNKLTGTWPEELAELSFLTKLNLGFNDLTGLVPEKQPPNIEILNFANNSFHGTIPNFVPIDSLRALIIDNNDQLSGCVLLGYPKYCSLTGFRQHCTCEPPGCASTYPPCCSEKDLNCPPCRNGYKRYNLTEACLDIDECSLNSTLCSYKCVNIPGSYYCTCPPGQQLYGYTCRISYEEENKTIQAIAAGVSISVLAVLIIIGTIVIVIIVRRSKWKLLPQEINWSFASASELIPKGWKKTKGYYILRLQRGDDKYNKVVDLFNNHLDGEGLEIESIDAVYNPNLTYQFSLERAKMDNRVKTAVKSFKREDYIAKDTKGLKKWVGEKYKELVAKYPWNKQGVEPIIPVVHGTDYNYALIICQNGFLNLSTLDAGWYGKGIYFTSSAKYALPYYAQKNTPCVILSYVVPGNPYPITEHPASKESFIGAPVPAKTPGYQSHYIRTTSKGFPIEKPTEDSFDEIVVSQESYIVPAFIITLEKESLQAKAPAYEREILPVASSFARPYGGDVTELRLRNLRGRPGMGNFAIDSSVSQQETKKGKKKKKKDSVNFIIESSEEISDDTEKVSEPEQKVEKKKKQKKDKKKITKIETSEESEKTEKVSDSDGEEELKEIKKKDKSDSSDTTEKESTISG